MGLARLSQHEFSGKLHAGFQWFQDNRKAAVDRLSQHKSVIVYSYGTKGRDLAGKLRDAGVDCLIFDNSPRSLQTAAGDGFRTISDLALDLPLIVAAGQNQISILSQLARPAFALQEGLYAFDLINQCGMSRLFTQAVLEADAALYDLYQRLDDDCREDFLNVLLYRCSLDVRHIASTRQPVGQMWVTPAGVKDIRSFCDVGAYDGDTLTAMKALFPSLESSFAIEPNADLLPKIEAAATNSGLKNKTFIGAAWSHKTKLNCRILPNGMMVISEDATGPIDADALDSLTSAQCYEYVKFDVEGAEAPAIRGAHSLLRASRCIAIAGYHLPNDLLDIPDAIAGVFGLPFQKDWRLAFRHYSECFDDSIFYFYRRSR